jgi:general stress protein 26
MKSEPTAQIDARFSDSESRPTPWADVERLLEAAELYWISTVRVDGRPHVTPLVGLMHDGVMHFCTGLEEQKARNIEQNEHVALTTGSNDWARGTDVVVEGTVTRITDRDRLQVLADAYEAKYGSDWHFDVGNDAFESSGGPAAVFRIEATKVMAFAKDPHGQTTYRF